jgi:hypothetical protein
MTGIFRSTRAAAILLALLSCAIAAESEHEKSSAASGETDETSARYLSQGPFADDPSGSDLSAPAGLARNRHYNSPLYRTDTVEDFHRLAEGVNEHFRTETSKLEKCQREKSALREVC